MTDRPIIFSQPMVLAMLAGRKTQTRRLARSRHVSRVQVGDRLWVREGWRRAGWSPAEYAGLGATGMACDIEYLADGERRTLLDPDFEIEKAHGSGLPSIHMFRWVSRLTLTVTEVRTQRITSIGGHDARCEGVERLPEGDGWKDYSGRFGEALSAVESFATLWDSLHGKIGERWQDKPEVIALTFAVTATNIDKLETAA